MKVTELTYQQSNFLALMNGYTGSNGVLGLYAKALDSSGTAQAKFNLYQQGTEAQLARLKDAWDALWMSMFKSNEIQGIIGSLTGLVNGITAINNSFGTLPTIAGTATAAIFLFNSKVKESFANLTSSVSASIKEFGLLNTTLLTEEETYNLLYTNMGVLEKGLLNVSVITRGAGIAFSTLWTTIKAFSWAAFTTALPVAGVMLLTTAIEKLVEAYQQQKAEQDAIAKQGQDLAKTYSANASEIDKLTAKYEELNSKSANDSSVKSSKEYVDTMNQLGKLMPSLVDSTDKHGNSVLKSSQYVKDELDYAKQLKDTYDHMTVDNLNKNIDDQSKTISDIINKINEAKKNQLPTVSGKIAIPVDQGTKDYWYGQQLTDQHNLQAAITGSSSMVQSQVKAYMDIQGITDKLTSSNQKLINSYINQALASGKNLQNSAEIKQFLTDLIDKTSQYAQELTKIPNDLRNVFSPDQLDSLLQSQNKNQLDTIKSIDKEVQNGGTNWKSYRNELMSVFNNASLVDKIINTLTDSVKKQNDANSQATKSQTDYNAAVQTMIKTDMAKANAQEMILGSSQQLINDTKDLITTYQLLSNQEGLSAEQTQQLADAKGKLIALYPQYVENGQLNVEQMRKETEAEDILLKAINDVANGHATAEEMMTLNAAQQSKNRLETMSKELQGLQTLQQTYIKASEDQLKMAEQFNNNGNQSQSDLALGLAQQAQGQASKTGQDYADLKKQIDALIPSYDSQIQKLAQATNYQGQYYNGTQQSTYVSDKYKQSIDALNASISNLESLQKNYAEDSQQYRDALQQEIGLLTQKQQLMQSQAQSLQQQIASGNITQYGMISGGNGGSGGALSSASLSSGNVASQIWNFLKSNGMSDGAAAGIMGNLMQESSLNPNAAGGGLAQWIGSRGTALNNFANSMGLSSNSLQAQLGYLWKEISSGSQGVNIGSLNGMSASQAAQYFSNQFERPGNPMMNNRINYANQFYSQFAGTGGDSSGGSSSAAQNAQAIDQAKASLLQMQQDIFNGQQQIQQMQAAVEQSKIDSILNPFKNTLSNIDLDFKNSQMSMKRYTELSANWNFEMDKQIRLQQQKVALNQQEEQTVQNLLNTENLSLQQKVDLTNQYQQLDDASYQYLNDLNDLYNQQRTAMADNSVNAITNAYNDQITALQQQSTELDKINQQQQRNQQQADLQAQIDKAKSDTSHEYIDSSGKVTFTYDKTAVAGLEQQMTDLQTQWSQQDQKDALTQEINDLTTKRDDTVNQLKQLVTDYSTSGFKTIQDLQTIMTNFTNDFGKIVNQFSAANLQNSTNNFLTSIGLPKHHDGGIVGSVTSNSKLSGLINTLFNVKPNEAIVKALKGEIMIPEGNIPNFIGNIKTMVGSFADKTAQIIQPKNYYLSNFTIKADNPMEFFKGIDTLITSE